MGEIKRIVKDALQAFAFWIVASLAAIHFLGYAGRYIRRPPISQKRILKVTANEVVYLAKHTETNRWVETTCTLVEFIDLLRPHVLDRYRPSMRYFRPFGSPYKIPNLISGVVFTGAR